MSDDTIRPIKVQARWEVGTLAAKLSCHSAIFQRGIVYNITRYLQLSGHDHNNSGSILTIYFTSIRKYLGSLIHEVLGLVLWTTEDHR